jgi:hypothetical protein
MSSAKPQSPIAAPGGEYQRRLTNFSDAMRFLKSRGVSPRSTITLYDGPAAYSPREDLAPLDNPAPPVASNDASDNGPTGTKSFSVGAEIESYVDSTAVSPSFAVSPSPSLPDVPSNDDLPESEPEVREAGACLAAGGFEPFRVVLLKKTGDQLVLCMTPLGDRVAVYLPADEDVGLADAPAGVPRDVTTETQISTAQEAEQLGAYALAETAGMCSGKLKFSSDSTVFGVLAASTSVSNPAAGRYFSLMCTRTPAVSVARSPSPESDNTPDEAAPAGDMDIFLFSQTAAAIAEMRNGAPEASFACAFTVMPIVNADDVVRDITNGASTVSDAVRAVTPTVEQTHLSTSTKRLFDSTHARTKRIVSATAHVRDMFMEAHAARTIETAAVLKHNGAVSTQGLVRLAALTAFSARIEELLGVAWTRIELLLSEAEDAAEKALACAFVESRLTVSPTFANGAGYTFARAVKWGFPRDLDGFSFARPFSGNPFLDAATRAADASTFLQEELLRHSIMDAV